MSKVDIPSGEYTAVTATDDGVAADVAEAGVQLSANLLPSEAPGIAQPSLNSSNQDFEIS